MAHLVLLSGLPGIGKTTIATALQSPYYERIHFGGLLRTLLERRHREPLPHSQFRQRFSDLIDSYVLTEASILARERANNSLAQVCILDSHAVTPTSVGLRVTPDNNARMQALRLDAIVHLRLAGSLSRVLANCGTDGRHALTEVDATLAEHIQLSTVVLYASYYDCPLLVVPAEGSIVDNVRDVDAAVRSAIGWQRHGT